MRCAICGRHASFIWSSVRLKAAFCSDHVLMSQLKEQDVKMQKAYGRR